MPRSARRSSGGVTRSKNTNLLLTREGRSLWDRCVHSVERRRLRGHRREHERMAKMCKRITGTILKDRWQIPVRQARYREDGKWYHHLCEFPAALCDENGYVVFESEEAYVECPWLHHAQDLHVDGGIKSMPRYRLAPFPARECWHQLNCCGEILRRSISSADPAFEKELPLGLAAERHAGL